MRTSRLLALLIVSACELPAADDFPLVPDDLEVSLFAKEPLVRNPCAITFDAQGRLCVGMGPQYRNPKLDTPGDSVWILIDENGDGTADSRKEYATGFNSIQGLAWRGRDLYVANAPDLTIARDLDGDDEADEYIRLYTDLGNLEHALHGLNFGPDGKLYMSKGNSKGLTQLPDRVAPRPFRQLWGVEAPGAPDFPAPGVFKKDAYRKNYHDPADDWGLSGGVLRCDPDGSNLEIVSRGFRNPWDICYDDEFNWLGTDNDQTMGDKIFSPFYGAHFGWGHMWSYDWKGDEHLPTAPSAGPLFEGSGTGVVYCGIERYPEKYRGVFLINDWLRREVYIYRPKWKGAWMQADRKKLEIFAHAGGGRSMGKSSGRSFDPVDIEVGPDGAIYIASWGREYGLTEKDGKQVNEGRIYRIWPKDAPPRVVIEDKWGEPLAQWSAKELWAEIGSDLPARRINVQAELVQRGMGRIGHIQGNLGESQRQDTWLYWTFGLIDPEQTAIDTILRVFFNHPRKYTQAHQLIRILAHRIKRRNEHQLPDALKPFLQASNIRARHEIILAMRSVGETRWSDELLDLIASENDRVVYYSAWGALMELMPQVGRKALLSDERPAVRRAAFLSLLEEDALSDPEIRTMSSDEDEATASLAARRLGGKAKTEIRGPNLNPQRGRTAEPESTVPPVSVVTSIESQPGRKYEEALLTLGTLAYTDRDYRIKSLPSELEGLTFIRAANNDADFASGPFLKLKLRYDSTVLLADDMRGDKLPKWARGKWTSTKLGLTTDDARHRIYAAELPAGEVTFGPNLDDVKGRKSNYLVIVKPKLLSPPKTITTAAAVMPLVKKADAVRGRALFLSTAGAACSACHQLEGIGNVFAPDLSEIGKRADAAFLVRSILEPSAEITEGFVMQILTTRSGDITAGIVLGETGLAVQVALMNGSVRVVAKKDITKRETAPLSAMPPTFAAMLNPQDVADITAYLLSPRKKPVVKPIKKKPASKQVTTVPAGKASPLSGKRWGDKKEGFHLECHDERLVIHYHAVEIASYYYRHPQTRRPFFAHVKTPGGIQVTRNFPPMEGKDATDHAYMHPGISMGFANFEGVSFWHNNEGVVIHEKFMVVPTAGATASFAVENRYLAPDGREMCREWASYHLIPNRDGYLITMDSRMHAERPFWLGVREEMGLAMRVATPITVKNKGSILSARGGKNEKGTWGKVDKWWDYFGPLGIKSAGIQVMTAPGNPEVWSHSRDYGVLVANPLPVDRKENRGKKIEVKVGAQFRLRFGVQIHEHTRRDQFDPAASYERYLKVVE